MRKVKEFREMVRATYFKCEDKHNFWIHCYKIRIEIICIRGQLEDSF